MSWGVGLRARPLQLGALPVVAQWHAAELGCPCVAIHRHTSAHISEFGPVPRRSLHFTGILS
jgi:hypothetical protein